MKNPATDAKSTELASGFTVAECEQALKSRDREAIAEAIRRRFTERYILPVAQSSRPHGFTLMAISCLMIESFESFHQGWRTTDGHEEEAFNLFFKREAAFADFIGYEKYFFRNVRCAILHQGETYHGWKIRRSGVLFDKATLTINADAFLNGLQIQLNALCDRLKATDWKSDEWKRVQRKMRALCDHCCT